MQVGREWTGRGIERVEIDSDGLVSSARLVLGGIAGGSEEVDDRAGERGLRGHNGQWPGDGGVGGAEGAGMDR